MTERPILFSAPMVRALLAGTKTQTRRAWRDQPPPGVRVAYVQGEIRCPYGQPGDRLWVREAWRAPAEFDRVKPSDLRAPGDGLLGTPIIYEASRHESVQFGKLRPGMFMPRWASRITLEVTGVRVEQLQDISEADARAEGARECDPVSGREVLLAGPSQRGSFVLHYRDIWAQINGPGSWDANPWVWVVEIRRLR